jgi:hypothetical protein
MNEEFIFIAPPIVKPEFRLYYDETGTIICYSCDNTELPHKYIVIDSLTYAESRPDVKVVNGKVVRKNVNKVISKYVKSDEGISCLSEDISIISDSPNSTFWTIEVKEIE